MSKSTIEMELKKIFIEQSNLKQDYISTLKKNLFFNNKNIKRFVLSSFMKHISESESLALFDEEIFNIYKMIIDRYILFLDNIRKNKYKFNDEVLKNLSGITSVLESQIRFFSDKCGANINPIYTEKKNITAIYIDKIYKSIDELSNLDIIYTDIDGIMIRENFINKVIELITTAYKQNLISCLNALNDKENREEISYFNDVLEEEREILSSIIKLQIVALEKICKNEEEKLKIDKLLEPIVEVYQQTSKSFDELNNKIKNLNISLNIDFKEDDIKIRDMVFDIFKNVEFIENRDKDKILDIIKKYILKLKDKKVAQEEDKVKVFREDIENALNLADETKKSFECIVSFINDKKEDYKDLENSNIIDGIYESLVIKVDNIQEKLKDIDDLKNNTYVKLAEKINDLKKDKSIPFDLENIYQMLKENLDLEEIEKNLDFDTVIKEVEKIYIPCLKKLDDFIKNTLLFEISTFQEIIYYSVIRLRDKSELKNLVGFIDNINLEIEKNLIENGIEVIKPKPHDKFSAKEHEVLLAEKNEEFLKGEIIKVINYGFKSKEGSVIKRATVIAAK